MFAWSSCVSLCQTDNHSTKVDPPRHRRVDAAAVISFKWLLNAHKHLVCSIVLSVFLLSDV